MARERIKWHYLKNIESILQKVELALGGTNDGTGIEIVTTVASSVASSMASLATADASLATGAANESSSRVAADTVLTTAVANESASRVAADNTLTTAVVNESSSRVAADNTLTTAVANESSSRVAADNALDTKAESASTRASSVAVNLAVTDSKILSANTYAMTSLLNSACQSKASDSQASLIASILAVG